MKILILIIPLFLTCAYHNPIDNQKQGIPIEQIIIWDQPMILWYNDSLYKDMIWPAELGDSTNIVIWTGNLNYEDTDFPDTFWGIFNYNYFPDETLSCVKCTCWANDTVVYDMVDYFDSLGIEFNEIGKDGYNSRRYY